MFKEERNRQRKTNPGARTRTREESLAATCRVTSSLGQSRQPRTPGGPRPLLDHFHPPLQEELPGTTLHHAWATFIMQQLNRSLPRALAHIHLGG
jgi:hypothetical protein